MPSPSQSPLELPLDLPPSESTYVLHHLEVFNWGPFAGIHHAEIDPRGTAVIGPTGSGKTTLIDGLMTLLVPQPKYNLASTGGHESDRTLISYVRGVLGGDGSNVREEVARPGKTWTGLCATYRNGEETLKLGAILWTEGSSNASQDLKRRWIFSLADDESLENWIRLAHDEGVRHLIRHGRDTARLRIFDSKKAYLAHVRKFFDVGENAFTLLNRAAGLKQLNSIDEIFRDLVLDDHSAFGRALEVAGEFNNLAEIHTELETARRQQESLLPITQESRKLAKSQDREALWSTLKRIIPTWFALAGEKKWAEVTEELGQLHHDKSTTLRTEQQLEKNFERTVDTFRERFLQLGGNVIGELQRTITEQEERVTERRRHAEIYLQFAEKFDLDDELNQSALAKNQTILKNRRKGIEKLREKKQEQTLEAHSWLRDEQAHAIEVKDALDKVRDRPGSNIPPKFQDFRAALAERLALNEEDLPFLAEMVEVKPGESTWRGAIERAIGPERLRILVPENRIDAALRWVNDRNNHLHVRLQEAQTHVRPRESFPDGFTRKLNFKSHPLENAVMDLLASRDRHCVASPDDLKLTEHGMTLQGLMSGRRGKFEKQDQKRLDQGWMTGFDNQDQLRALENESEERGKRVEQWKETTQQHQRQLNDLDGQLTMIDRIIDLEFSTIDLPGAKSVLASSTTRLESLLDPESDASKAKIKFDEENDKLTATRTRIGKINQELAVIRSDQARAQASREKAATRAGEGLTEEEASHAKKKLSIDPKSPADQLDDEERKASHKVVEELTRRQKQVQDHEKRLIQLMEKAQRVDTGALAETGTELMDIPDYLEQLRVLDKEALPEKLHQFLEYLNRSSDQGVTQLLSSITEEVDGIEQRIMELNQTLAKVDFRSRRYLQLQPQQIRHERLRTLETAQRHLRSAALKDDQGESHYKALRGVIEILQEASDNPRQLGSRALLDPRYRLQFFVIEVDRATGNHSSPRSGSQSGSGGEKELMASHILTASLSYALCPSGASQPLYGTVVLDEAFSKSSPSAATQIIKALRIFGLHPIFVTPNKEIGLLKKHTRKVICVQRPGKQASLASISWEKLEELARPK